jgi:hypothetical protein
LGSHITQFPEFAFLAFGSSGSLFLSIQDKVHLERTERLAAPVQDWRDGGQRNSGESSQTDKRVLHRPAK